MFCTQCQAGVLSSSKSIDFSLFPEVSIRLNLSSLGVDKDGLQSKCWSITGSQITNCVKHINRFKFLVQLKGSGLYFGLTHLHSRASNAELWIGHVVAFGQHCIDHPLQKCWYDDNSCIQYMSRMMMTRKKEYAYCTWSSLGIFEYSHVCTNMMRVMKNDL